MTASFADNEIWHVLIASDDMKRMNVDQLDDAFRLSLVDASTLVWKAGMKTWQSLGSVAGIDDEPEESVTRRVPPPPPPPMPAPRRQAAALVATSPNPFLAPPSANPSHNPFVAAANPFAATAPAPFASPFAQAPALKAPVYTPPLRAPDPYLLPKRRASVPSEVDFRRSSGGVRWGRWLVMGLLLTAGVLALYRQNLLREGARRVGLENKYLYGERRVTAYVDAKAPSSLRRVLTQLALLPGPNAIVPKPALTPPAAPAAPLAAAPTPSLASEPARTPADDVKTVSLDALPVEPTGPVATAAPPEPKTAPLAKATPKVASAPRPKSPANAEKPVKVAKAVVEKPKAAPKPAPPPANDNPLKAAIRSAIAADAAKK